VVGISDELVAFWAGRRAAKGFLDSFKLAYGRREEVLE
jgi:hypothetical protein